MISSYPHLIDLNDYPASWWKEVVDLGEKIKEHPEIYSGACQGKIMATLFYEPSTRTQMSFQTAMLRLGGRLIGFDNPANSSVSKGETLKDTTKIVSNYADILVMRHPVAGAAKAAALTADCPVINAGDSGHLHPTQTLTDLLTLKCEKGHLDNLTIGLCGDLINGRTVHSLIKAMSCFEGNKFVLISTPELKLPSYVKDILKASGCPFEEVTSLEAVLPELDVLYMTRIQQERFASREEYLSQKDTYILTVKKLKTAKPDMIILHPLPRVDEIEVAIDEDPRAAYFKQARYGMYVRMALIITMLNLDTKTTLLHGRVHNNAVCKNPNCITCTEKYLPKSFVSIGDDLLECEYCNERLLLER
ncbi:MAG: aspartate carbamoyltransferase [Ruminococcus sp.]|nr:aspartate carbamoyltransferase [Ruminococcus sp.]